MKLGAFLSSCCTAICPTVAWEEGCNETLASAATHGYLPLLGRDSSIYGQLRTGVEGCQRHFGRLPRVVWLPECAYRPAYVSAGEHMRPGGEHRLMADG